MHLGQRGKTVLRVGRIALPAGLFAGALLLVLATRDLESVVGATPLPTVPPARTLHPADPPLPAPDQGRLPVDFSLKPRQTLGGALTELGLSPGEAFAAAEAAGHYVDVRRLRPGDHGTAYYAAADPRPAVMVLAVAERGRLQLQRAGEGWAAEWRAYERSRRTRTAWGTLQGSLEESLRDAGADPALAPRMADVLQWDIDFNRDLRTGDRFEVLYEEELLDGVRSRLGEVVALSYENGGRRLEAYRYGESGYYDGKGRPLRKMFLRSPLPYSRVTSRFSQRRFHPVLKIYRPHYGVDYGAPVGTPVRVTAGGVVSFVGWDGGGGKTVKVRHPNGFLTAYLHLSRYAKGMRAGSRVAQGDVVGYVGSTGLATAAHLDYRVQERGRWIDPLSLTSVPAAPVPPGEWSRFAAWRDSLQRRLRDGTALADAAAAARGRELQLVAAGFGAPARPAASAGRR
jgi:murein DD-endopeptidase MepM/ murein hydrolase activator NlpD